MASLLAFTACLNCIEIKSRSTVNTKSSNPNFQNVLSSFSYLVLLCHLPCFQHHFPSFVPNHLNCCCTSIFTMYTILNRCHPQSLTSASCLVFFVSPSLFDFPLSSPVISPPCGLRGSYAVLSHVKVHANPTPTCMLSLQ